MSDPTGSAHRDRERFLKSVPIHLELLQKARTELEEDPVEAAAALRRFSRFIADEAARLQLADTGEAARGLAEEASADLAVHADALEAALRQLLAEEETPVQILIVEDEPTSALLAQRALEGDGRTIYVVRTAKEARAALEGHEINLVVLDLILPDADGRHLLMELSREVDPARTSVVVLTAKGTPTTRAECFA